MMLRTWRDIFRCARCPKSQQYCRECPFNRPPRENPDPGLYTPTGAQIRPRSPTGIDD